MSDKKIDGTKMKKPDSWMHTDAFRIGTEFAYVINGKKCDWWLSQEQFEIWYKENVEPLKTLAELHTTKYLEFLKASYTLLQSHYETDPRLRTMVDELRKMLEE